MPKNYYTVNQLIGSYYIRYDRLYELITSYYSGSSAENIDLYLDVTPLIKNLYGNTDVEIDSITLTACLYNMCAHYRNFFKTRFNVGTRIFIVCSSMITPLNHKYLLDYSNKPPIPESDKPNVTQIISKSFDLLDLLCNYTQDVYLVQTQHEAAVAIYGLLLSSRGLVPNIIISKDLYDYQLVSVPNSLSESTIVIRPKKVDNNDISYIVDKNNILSVLLVERKVKVAPKEIFCLDSSLYSLILALTRLPERHIKSLLNLPDAIRSLSEAIQSNDIYNGWTVDADRVAYTINKGREQTKKINEFEVANRFNAIDIISQFDSLQSTGIPISIINMTNLYDPNGMKEIINKYFGKDNTLDVMGMNL